MTQIQDLIVAGFLSVLTGIAMSVVSSVKKYLIAKGGEKAVKIVEIVAKNAVHAVEQIASETKYNNRDKLRHAKEAVTNELEKYNIYMSDKELTVFIESAVKQMKDTWEAR